MSKLDRYLRSLEFCLDNAAKAPFEELRDLWQTIGNSYRFLAELESRGRGEPGAENLDASAPEAMCLWPINERPIVDRIRS